MKIRKFNEDIKESLHNLIDQDFLEDIFQDLEDFGFAYIVKRSNEYGHDGQNITEGDIIGIKMSLKNDIDIKEYTIDKDKPKYIPALNNYRVIDSKIANKLYELISTTMKSIDYRISKHGYSVSYFIGEYIGQMEIDILIK